MTVDKQAYMIGQGEVIGTQILRIGRFSTFSGKFCTSLENSSTSPNKGHMIDEFKILFKSRNRLEKCLQHTVFNTN